MASHRDDNANFLRSEEVFVLGAGFTQAFYPKSPLMIDDYHGQDLLKKFDNFPNAHHILESEINRNNGLINIEYLMTRLEGLMPYDFDRRSDEELRMLSAELKKIFIKRLQEATEQGGNDDLKAFAKYCVDNRVPCITFNYDDTLDNALWNLGPKYQSGKSPPWHPDGGYGFLCKPARCTVEDVNIFMDITAILLLKLHGSVNWFPKRGYSRPYPVDAIMHHEQWFDLPSEIPEEVIQYHLEPEPFLVPPILTKSAIVEQPILRLLWHSAYTILNRASKVTFIGYSCPLTDIAGKFLFEESLESLLPSDIYVVNFAQEEKRTREIRDAYNHVFARIPRKNFRFDGALEWSRELAANLKT